MKREDLTPEEAYGWDDSKLVIFAKRLGKTNITNVKCGVESSMCAGAGTMLHERLLHDYHLQMEMMSADYVLGMTSIMDTDEGFARLSAALHEIDLELAGGIEAVSTPCEQGFTAQMYRSNPREMQIYQAMELPYQEVSFAEAGGEMSADYVYLYPPGIPLIVPGEVITSEFLERIRECIRYGLRVEGQANLSEERIKIVYF